MLWYYVCYSPTHVIVTHLRRCSTPTSKWIETRGCCPCLDLHRLISIQRYVGSIEHVGINRIIQWMEVLLLSVLDKTYWKYYVFSWTRRVSSWHGSALYGTIAVVLEYSVGSIVDILSASLPMGLPSITLDFLVARRSGVRETTPLVFRRSRTPWMATWCSSVA